VAARTDTDTGRTISGADRVLPSIAEWEKTQIGFVQALTQTRRSSHEAHFPRSRQPLDARSCWRRVLQDVNGSRLFDPVSRRAEA
jgi:hypothetical protein